MVLIWSYTGTYLPQHFSHSSYINTFIHLHYINNSAFYGLQYINHRYALQKRMGHFKDGADIDLELVKANPSKLIGLDRNNLELEE